MQQIQVHRAEHENRLRFVFGDRVIAFGLGAGVTFGEVARALRELTQKHCGDPIGIDFRLTNRRTPKGGVQSLRLRVTPRENNDGLRETKIAFPSHRTGDAISVGKGLARSH
jgi:hypothetical protein